MTCPPAEAGTPGCTKQAASFRDAYDKFKAKGVAVYGISSDSPEKNKEFAQAQQLPFPLLTDQGEFRNVRKDQALSSALRSS